MILFDVYKTARRQSNDYELKFFNNWWCYIAVFILYGFVLLPISENYTKTNLVRAYKIPAGSMLPTLQIGDCVLVDKTVYKNSQINRGDLIVFPQPNKPSPEYIKRVIAIPGDKLEIKNKIIFLNDIAQNEQYIMHIDTNNISQETSPRDNFGPITLPENSIFVLGDNRDNSFDSRFFGFISTDTVKGKVANIYWSWDKINSKVRCNELMGTPLTFKLYEWVTVAVSESVAR